MTLELGSSFLILSMWDVQPLMPLIALAAPTLGPLCPSCPKQVHLPSVFHTDQDDILKEYKVDAPMPDHLLARGLTHFRKKDIRSSLDATRRRSSPAMRDFSGTME